MDKSKSNRNWLKGKGYYLALALCVAAVGVSGYIYYRNTQKTPSDGSQSTNLSNLGETSPQAAVGDDTVAVLATDPLILVPEDTTEPVQEPIKTSAPVAGEVSYGYAMEALSYNETTKDWRTHNGADYACETGTVVCAAADGTVTKVYSDDSFGWTVEIDHGQGYTTYYSGLSEEIPVSVGQSVAAGESIATIGDPSRVETAQGAHLHFAVTQNGEAVDPDYFLGQE